jgi:DNA polymerase sigma
LQERIAAFVECVVPNAQEQQHRDACMAAFTRVAADSLPEYARAMQVALFGSGAAGLALHSSDLDVVLIGKQIGACIYACRTGSEGIA